MYDNRHRSSLKMQPYRGKKCYNSLPKLTIIPDFQQSKLIRKINKSCMQKISQYHSLKNDQSFKKDNAKSHDFLHIMDLRKSSVKESIRNAGPITTKPKLSIKQQCLSKYQGSKVDDVMFCKQRIQEFQKSIVVIRDRLTIEKNLKIRVKSSIESADQNRMIASLENKSRMQPQANGINILTPSRIDGRDSRVAKFSKIQQKLTRIYPQSYALKKKPKKPDSQFSPWNSSYPDLIQAQPQI